MGNNINDGLKDVFKKAFIDETKIELTFSSPNIDLHVRVQSLDVSGDYINDFGDSITAVFSIPKGDLIYGFIPFRDDLNMTVKLTENGVVKTRVMMAILDQLPAQLEDPAYRKLTRVDLNKALVNVQVHLLDLPLLALRSAPTNGIYLNKNLEEVIIDIFKRDAVDVSSLALYPIIDLRFTKPDNKRVYDHINLGLEKKVLGLPLFLHKEYGVYNAGMNVYKPSFEDMPIDKHKLHIYPPFVRPKVNKAILHIMDDHMMTATDNTHYIKDGVHHIAVKMSTPTDLDSSKYYSEGVNRTYMSPEHPSANKTNLELPNHILKYDFTNTIVKKKHETVIQDLLIPFSDMEHTDNPYDVSTSVLKQQFSIVQLSWSNALMTIFEPNMACLLVDEDMQKECHLVHTHFVYTPRGTNAIMTIAFKKKLVTGGGTDGTVTTQIL